MRTKMNQYNIQSHIQADSKKGFKLLYDTFYDQTYKTCYYICKDEEACKDILADFFLKVWKNIDTIAEVDSLSNYLFISIKNQTLNYLKANKKHQSEDLDVNISRYEPITEITPLDQIICKETSQIINDGIDALPEKRREIFKLSRLDQKAGKEIAKKKNIALKTVEDHIRKSLIFLRKEIAEYNH